MVITFRNIYQRTLTDINQNDTKNEGKLTLCPDTYNNLSVGFRANPASAVANWQDVDHSIALE